VGFRTIDDRIRADAERIGAIVLPVRFIGVGPHPFEAAVVRRERLERAEALIVEPSCRMRVILQSHRECKP
jgi:hypothetical protein